MENQIPTEHRNVSILSQEDRKNKRIHKKIHEWTEVYITIPKESRLEKSQVRDRKINKLLQHFPTDNFTKQN